MTFRGGGEPAAEHASSARSSAFAWSWTAAKPTLAFLAGWCLLDAMVNLRYPGPEPALWYLVPSLDVVLVFGALAWFAWRGWRVPSAARIALCVLMVWVRLLRFGDGAFQQYYADQFRLRTDLALIPELFRFARSSLGFWNAILCCAAVLAVLTLLCLTCHYVLLQAERYLSEARHRYAVALLCGLSFLAVSLTKVDDKHAGLYHLGFGASVVPRLAREAESLLAVRSDRAEHAALVARVRQSLRSMPTNLSRLQRRNVYLFLVESYGKTVLDRPVYAAAVAPVYDAFEAELGGRGFAMASGLLDSPVYGGRSWLAHATLDTGVRTANELQYEVVRAEKPQTLAHHFRDAGYRTVLVQPGTTRPSPVGEFDGFEQKYCAYDFDYRGPSFAWATMPDQYVIDFVHRREIADRSQPLFLQYVLVTSHAPWSHLPPFVDDWSEIGNGAIYQRLPTRHYRIEWPGFENASQAYIDSIVYDLQVLQRYLRDFIQDESLILIVGDHQPVSEVSAHSASHAVPIHVLSRDPAMLEPLLARGYSRGMRPRQAEPHPGLETFMVNFLNDFSSGD